MYRGLEVGDVILNNFSASRTLNEYGPKTKGVGLVHGMNFVTQGTKLAASSSDMSRFNNDKCSKLAEDFMNDKYVRTDFVATTASAKDVHCLPNIDILHSTTFRNGHCLCTGSQGSGHLVGPAEQTFLIISQSGPSVLTANPNNNRCLNVLRIAAATHLQVFNVIKGMFNPAGQSIGRDSVILVYLPLLGGNSPVVNLNMQLDLCKKIHTYLTNKPPCNGMCRG